ncbi:MAG: VOC family protein [Vulcanimicrobiaceae bacterium]
MQTVEAVKVRGIGISTYLVKDVARAKAFYRDTMGLGGTIDYGDGTTFGIWKMEDGTWSAGDGVMFAVDDVSKATEYFRSRGVKIADHTVDSPSCYMAFGEDSEGNSFILHQRKGGRS